MLPRSSIPTDIQTRVQEIGSLWASSEHRPRLDVNVVQHWDLLIDSWASSDLPLAVRKSGGVRGAAIAHATGRTLVLADNSPAQWAFSRAFDRQQYSLDEIRGLIQHDQVPFVFVRKRAEINQMRFKCALAPVDNVNKRGWKLCHIKDIGLRTAVPISELPLDTLVRHFCLLMKPSNHFVVPLSWPGLGELPGVIEQVRRFEAARSSGAPETTETG